jgi:integrase
MEAFCPFSALALGPIPRARFALGLRRLPRVQRSGGHAQLGRIADARSSHSKVLAHVEINALTLHGLRRSFSQLGEAAGAPAGAIAQVMGHKPSATAEGYRPRSIDALRPYIAQIEAHILQKAGIEFVPDEDDQPALRVVTG